MVFKRNLQQLKMNASLHWTEELKQAAIEETLLNDLLKTQDLFISILKLANNAPDSWMQFIAHSKDLSLQMFAKHLMILSDLGGETLTKLLPIKKYFPKHSIVFDWYGDTYTYSFQKVQYVTGKLDNTKLRLTRRTINGNCDTALLTDVIMIILFGSQDINAALPFEYSSKAQIGQLLGNPDRIDDFVKANYIKVSTQIKGADSNALGHFAQDFVSNYLQDSLPKSWNVKTESSLPGVTHTFEDGSESNFDIVVKSPKGTMFGIEVSFQVTTNSTFERKARDSAALYSRVKNQGHHICYVLDGAGNINIREKACEIICSNSDCTVALSRRELQVLVKYLTTTDQGL